jgi:catechol-2,3-dioxygenase
MTEVKSKGKIRHFAFSVADPWETAEFYKDVMGLDEVSAPRMSAYITSASGWTT